MTHLINDFPNYMVTSTGEIFSRYKFKTDIVTDEWRPVKQVLDTSTGYFIVTLVHEGKRSNKSIHRLLAQHFIPNPENKAHVNHIDGNKQNNLLSNLEWTTPKENAQHAARIGLCDARNLAQSVAVVQLTKEGLFIARHSGLHEASRSTGIAWQNIWKVVRGIRPYAGGYCWKYE